MLEELHVKNLGVIENLTLELTAGMTTVTGETGAGKTLVVTAIELLVGGKAEQHVIGPHGTEAIIEGRFLQGDDETILRRVVTASGRSRAYVNGEMATVAVLSETAASLVDLHGQHAHQSLLHARTQRELLDTFGEIDSTAVNELRREVAAARQRLTALDQDERARAQELDLVQFQLRELNDAELVALDEDETLTNEERQLSDVSTFREASQGLLQDLDNDGGAADQIANSAAQARTHEALAPVAGRLDALHAELVDIVSDIRTRAADIVDDPDRLETIRTRQILLRDLKRKYGPLLSEVIAHRDQLRERLQELESHDETLSSLSDALHELEATRDVAEGKLAKQRTKAATSFASAISTELADLGMPNARIEVRVSGAAGDDVALLLQANAGGQPLPLQKAASGGELARTMLAIRLAVGRTTVGDVGTMIFDEVDAGIGGEAAVAVGHALARLATGDAQVLVVTHLPQVAAFAGTQVQVRKDDTSGITKSSATVVSGEDRVIELSRMLSGQPDSSSARKHAKELLQTATELRSA